MEQTLKIKDMVAVTPKPIRLLQAIEKACKQYCGKEYFFKYDVEG